MATRKFNLWFSERQKAKIVENGESISFGILENGRIVEYTEAISIDSDEICTWNDAKFLGIGTFDHSE